jgi:hypothetical protein
VIFVAITLYVAFQRVFIVVRLYFVIESVRKLLDVIPVAFLFGCKQFCVLVCKVQASH